MLSIRSMQPLELPAVYRRVARDFPPIEYPPLSKMRALLARGAVEGVLCERQGLPAAYAFLLCAAEAKSLLLLLYAVEPEMRGLGVGSSFLRALLERASGTAGLYAEVEKEELAPDAAERQTRARRIAFYERLGFSRVEGLYYSIYGVEMHLFYRPLADTHHPDAAGAAAELAALYGGFLAPGERRHLIARPCPD